ncbi:MAG: DUF6174 domain-containing protein [Solirubrobacteraceae bacterium]
MRLLPLVVVLLLAAPADAAMTWSRSGGFAGVQETLTIGRARHAVAVGNGRRVEARLSRKRYAHLRTLLDRADLGSLRPSYPATGAADTFQYAVGWRGHTVRADETQVPDRLRPPLAALGRVFDDLQGRAALRDPQLAALSAARARWRAAALDSYRFRLRVSCYCPGAGVYRVIRVRDGKPHGGEGADRSVDTVPEMFRLIGEALRDPSAGDVEVRYDKTLGFPRVASVDRLRAAIDDEISWTAIRLRALAR